MVDKDLINIPTEHEEQSAFVQWLTLKKILFYAIPNGSNKNPMEAAKFKREGLISGVPDICIPIARKSYHGLYIEIKRIKKYTISDNQKLWLSRLTEQGYLAVIGKGCDDCIRIVEHYLS